MTTTTRRGFFARLAGLLGAVVAAHALPEDTFLFREEVNLQPERLIDPGSGMSIRFVRQYDLHADRWPTRLDVLYGAADVTVGIGGNPPQMEAVAQHLCDLMGDDFAGEFTKTLPLAMLTPNQWTTHPSLNEVRGA